jgi:CheY-like chemotaxis protein
MDVPFDHHAVLLVEDNPDDAFLMKSAWKSARISNPLPLVTDGEQALDYLHGRGDYSDRRKFPMPVAVFLDLKLPRIDGLEVLAAIREDPGLCRLHVDVLSASARSADVEKALALGANNYFMKPSRVEDLVQMVSSWSTLARFKMYAVPGTR